jgi:hypothetical protein
MKPEQAKEMAVTMLDTSLIRTSYLNENEIGRLESALISEEDSKVRKTLLECIFVSEKRRIEENSVNKLDLLCGKALLNATYPLAKAALYCYGVFLSKN